MIQLNKNSQIPKLSEVLKYINEDSAKYGIFIDKINVYKEIYRLYKKVEESRLELVKAGILDDHYYYDAKERIKLFAINNRVNHLLLPTAKGEISLGLPSINNLIDEATKQNVDPNVINVFKAYSEYNHNQTLINQLKGSSADVSLSEAPTLGYLSFDGHLMSCVHSVYEGQVTGRFAPTKPAIGCIRREIQSDIITAPYGFSIWDIDMGQIDPRLYAMLILKDSTLSRLIVAYNDAYLAYIHYCKMKAGIADYMTFDPKPITDEMLKDRQEVKTLTNAVNYGQAINATSELSKLFNTYISCHPNRMLLISKIKEELANGGTKFTPYFRSMDIDITQTDSRSIDKYGKKGLDDARCRKAISAMIQGTTAEIMRYAYVNIRQYLTENSQCSMIVGSIHDSLKVLVADDDFDNLKDYLKTCLSIRIDGFSVPIDCKVTFRGNVEDEPQS